MYVYVHKIREDKFDDCKKSFSWLDQKVNKKINVYGHVMPTTPALICAHSQGMTARPGKASRHHSVF